MFDIDKICIVGGDMRQLYLGRLFAADGKFVTYHGLEKLPEAQPDFASLKTAAARCDTIVLPAPLSVNGKKLNAPFSDEEIPLDGELAETLKGKRVFCGRASVLETVFGENDMKVYDLLAREDYAVLNAVPTAEGAIAAAVYGSDKTIHGSRCLVAGFGRIGKALAPRLDALGAEVTVSTRKAADTARAESMGFRAVNTADIAVSGCYDYIFNTIPAMIFNYETLRRIACDAFVVDLASKPGGVDLEACAELKIKARAELALPGRTAPEAAAMIIRKTIYNIAGEERS